jgi:hypothetical protein
MEFQDYHLRRLEQFEKKLDELKKELDDSRKKPEDTDTAGTERGPEDAEAVQRDLEHTERDLERHKVLLQWIEQKRQAMDTGYPTPVEDDQDAAAKAVRGNSTRDRRKRRPEASAILGKVRVSKAKPKKRNRQTQKPKALEFEPAIQKSDAISQIGIPQAPKRRETTRRRIKEDAPLRQLRPQRVSKAKRFADAGAKSLSGTQPRGAGQTRSPDRARSKRPPALQRSQPTPENVMTRSGRISMRPVR